MYRNLNFESLGISGRQSELIELTLSFGFKGFDLDLVEFSQQVQSTGLDHARRFIDSARLRLGSFDLPFDWDGDEEVFQRELAALPTLASLAAGLGCMRCRATLPAAGDVRPYHEHFELCRRRFDQIGARLAEHGVRLGIGFLAPAHHRLNRAFRFVHTFDELLLLVKAIATKNVGVCLDVWHWHVGGGTMGAITALSADEIVMLDLADASTPAGQDDVDETSRALPGRGDGPAAIDIPAILVALAAAGYDGPVTLRPDSSGFQGQKRDQVVAQARDALDHVWTAAGLNKSGKLVASGP